MKRDIVITGLLAFCLTATLFMTATTRSQEYDPWADLNEDGKIDILDIVGLTTIYGTTGDSTKDVTVTNWPVADQLTVFWAQTTSAWSSDCNASGFSQIHLTWHVKYLVDPESVTLSLYSYIYGPSYIEESFAVQSWVIRNADAVGAATIPVPSEVFQFYISFASGTEAEAYCAYYLTYA